MVLSDIWNSSKLAAPANMSARTDMSESTRTFQSFDVLDSVSRTFVSSSWDRFNDILNIFAKKSEKKLAFLTQNKARITPGRGFYYFKRVGEKLTCRDRLVRNVMGLTSSKDCWKSSSSTAPACPPLEAELTPEMGVPTKMNFFELNPRGGAML
jgi:hypothetical protein